MGFISVRRINIDWEPTSSEPVYFDTFEQARDDLREHRISSFGHVDIVESAHDLAIQDTLTGKIHPYHERNACYQCRHRQSVVGSAHSGCRSPRAHVEADPHGMKMGWFLFPYNFDPIWLLSCTGYEEIK